MIKPCRLAQLERRAHPTFSPILIDGEKSCLVRTALSDDELPSAGGEPQLILRCPSLALSAGWEFLPGIPGSSVEFSTGGCDLTCQSISSSVQPSK